MCISKKKRQHKRKSTKGENNDLQNINNKIIELQTIFQRETKDQVT
jgi:hypothetical protein